MRDKDCDFLCEKNDDIDNAVWRFIDSINKKDDNAFGSKLADVMEVLRVDESREIPQIMLNKKDYIISSIRKAIKRHMPRTVNDDVLEWSMGVVGDTTLVLESILADMNINVCHPYETETGCICYRSRQANVKCDYCMRH